MRNHKYIWLPLLKFLFCLQANPLITLLMFARMKQEIDSCFQTEAQIYFEAQISRQSSICAT